MEHNLAQVIRNRVAQHGNNAALRSRNANTSEYLSYSWNELIASVDNVARSLQAMGFGKNSMIGIFSDNKPQWTFTDLGILMTEGIVVPFFSTASFGQLSYIVKETRMELLFAGNHDQLDKAVLLFDGTHTLKNIVYFGETDLGITDPRIICWNDFLGKGNISQWSPESLNGSASMDDIATIIYTSGTTGEPKGVILTHGNFLSCFGIHDERLEILKDDVSLCFLPLSHIFERAWTFYMLYKGVSVVYLDNPKAVIEELSFAKPSLMCTVPRFFEKTFEGIQTEKAKWPGIKTKIFDWAIKAGSEAIEYRKESRSLPFHLSARYKLAELLVLKKLRLIFGGKIRMMPCSGAAIRPELLRFFHAAGIFINYGYGASETTATVSCFRTDRYEFESCGTVMPDLQVKISEEGEILVKGPTVFSGYYNKRDATDKVLKDGWYHTGDSGKFTGEGNLVMEDRIHDIFKTSVGKFVAPQKIELLLSRDPYIEQVVIIGDNRRFITALIVPSMTHLKQTIHYPENLSIDEYLLCQEVQEFFGKRLENIQQELTSYEKVVKFTLLSEPFSIENSILTSTLKVRRKVIAEKYNDEIERMYLS